jgi:hypothetical protein
MWLMMKRIFKIKKMMIKLMKQFKKILRTKLRLISKKKSLFKISRLNKYLNPN